MNNYDIENEYSEIIVRNVLKSIFNNIDHQIFINENKNNVQNNEIEFCFKFIPNLLNLNDMLMSQSLIEKNEKPIIIECPKTTRIDFHMSSKVFTNNTSNYSENLENKKIETPHKDSLFFNSMQNLNINSKLKDCIKPKDNTIFSIEEENNFNEDEKKDNSVVIEIDEEEKLISVNNKKLVSKREEKTNRSDKTDNSNNSKLNNSKNKKKENMNENTTNLSYLKYVDKIGENLIPFYKVEDSKIKEERMIAISKLEEIERQKELENEKKNKKKYRKKKRSNSQDSKSEIKNSNKKESNSKSLVELEVNVDKLFQNKVRFKGDKITTDYLGNPLIITGIQIGKKCNLDLKFDYNNPEFYKAYKLGFKSANLLNGKQNKKEAEIQTIDPEFTKKLRLNLDKLKHCVGNQLEGQSISEEEFMKNYVYKNEINVKNLEKIKLEKIDKKDLDIDDVLLPNFKINEKPNFKKIQRNYIDTNLNNSENRSTIMIPSVKVTTKFLKNKKSSKKDNINLTNVNSNSSTNFSLLNKPVAKQLSKEDLGGSIFNLFHPKPGVKISEYTNEKSNFSDLFNEFKKLSVNEYRNIINGKTDINQYFNIKNIVNNLNITDLENNNNSNNNQINEIQNSELTKRMNLNNVNQNKRKILSEIMKKYGLTDEIRINNVNDNTKLEKLNDIAKLFMVKDDKDKENKFNKKLIDINSTKKIDYRNSNLTMSHDYNNKIPYINSEISKVNKKNNSKSILFDNNINISADHPLDVLNRKIIKNDNWGFREINDKKKIKIKDEDIGKENTSNFEKNVNNNYYNPDRPSLINNMMKTPYNIRNKILKSESFQKKENEDYIFDQSSILTKKSRILKKENDANKIKSVLLNDYY